MSRYCQQLPTWFGSGRVGLCLLSAQFPHQNSKCPTPASTHSASIMHRSIDYGAFEDYGYFDGTAELARKENTHFVFEKETSLLLSEILTAARPSRKDSGLNATVSQPYDSEDSTQFETTWDWATICSTGGQQQLFFCCLFSPLSSTMLYYGSECHQAHHRCLSSVTKGKCQCNIHGSNFRSGPRSTVQCTLSGSVDDQQSSSLIHMWRLP